MRSKPRQTKPITVAEAIARFDAADKDFNTRPDLTNAEWDRLAAAYRAARDALLFVIPTSISELADLVDRINHIEEIEETLEPDTGRSVLRAFLDRSVTKLRELDQTRLPRLASFSTEARHA